MRLCRNIEKRCGSSRITQLSTTTWEFFTPTTEISKARSENTKRQSHWTPEMRHHNNLGVALRRKGDLDAAIREYREAKRLDPNLLSVRNNLASTLVDRDLELAILEFRELTAFAPDFEVCRVCFGSALYKKGDLPAAAEQYQEALKLDPSDPEAHCGLGLVFEKQEKYDAAMGEYRIAQQLDPDSALGHKGLGRVLQRKITPMQVAS